MALQDDESCRAFLAGKQFIGGFWEDIGGFDLLSAFLKIGT